MSNKKLGQDPMFSIQPVYNPNTGEMDYDYEYDERMGISKRLYIATAAMQGMCTNHLYQGSHRNDPKDLVRIAYELADEMLKQESEEINE